MNTLYSYTFIYSKSVFWLKILLITNWCISLISLSNHIEFIWVEKLKYFITNTDLIMVERDQSIESGEVIELLLGLASFHRKFKLFLFPCSLKMWSKAFRSLRPHSLKLTSQNRLWKVYGDNIIALVNYCPKLNKYLC